MYESILYNIHCTYYFIEVLLSILAGVLLYLEISSLKYFVSKIQINDTKIDFTLVG